MCVSMKVKGSIVSGYRGELLQKDILTHSTQRHVLPHVQTDGANLEHKTSICASKLICFPMTAIVNGDACEASHKLTSH